MKTGRELILATKPFTQEDRSKSWMHLVSTLLLLATALAGTVWLPYFLPKLVFSILSGLLMVRMFIIYHDFQHHAILHRSVLADVLMSAYGLLVLVPSSIWKRSHDHHHNHNSKLFSASIGSYPIATKEAYLAMPPGERKLYLFIRHPFTIVMGYFTMFMYGMCISSFVSAPRRHADSLLALVLHAVITYLAIRYLGWQGWLLTVFIPMFIASAMGAYLFYAQHNFPGTTFSSKEDWKYEVAALQSSSYMVMNPFMQFMTGNIGYHHIHHLNSRIPFYRLPEVMDAIPELQAAKTTSLKPKEIMACFRLKVWDPEKNRMIGLSEI
ncbi:MAG: fatty acid desaturase [Sphingobacteriales bacterium]|nr:MAG: fatty acid desaturase [Sphingobacteriales bacterium]